MNLLKKFRLNLFDILIGVLILTVIGSLLLLRMTKKPQWITVRLVVANNDWTYEGAPPQWWYGDNISPGQKAYNSFGRAVAEIVDVTNFDIGAYRRRTFVDIKLQGSFDSKRQLYLYNYQPIQIGKALDLTFGKQNIRGIVTYINELPGYTTRVVDVRLSALRPWVAASYKQGLTMTDSQNKTLAEIQSVTSRPSVVREVVETGQFTEKKYDGSGYVDVEMRLKLQVFQSGGVDYFVDRAAIKVGEQISFQFPQTTAREAEIIRIIE